MERVLHAFDLLRNESPNIAPVCALVGDDGFLRRLCRTRIRHTVSEDGEATEFGAKSEWRDVHDELSTLSLFGGGPRLVFVGNADDFVKNNRSQLESYAAQPASSGCLVLELNALAGNTRLYKTISETGQVIECRAPQKKSGKNDAKKDSKTDSSSSSKPASNNNAKKPSSTSATASSSLSLGTNFTSQADRKRAIEQKNRVLIDCCKRLCTNNIGNTFFLWEKCLRRLRLKRRRWMKQRLL